ncbi:hypothetical protein ACFX1W_014358 [Malus domestica]
MVPTVSVCLPVGLTESARSSAVLDESIHYLEGLIGSVYCRNVQFLAGRVAANWDAAKEVLCLPCPTLRHLV